jgi:electron transfer flavoprotein beta subunit
VQDEHEVTVKIAVCIKRVPDTETRIKIRADGKSIDESGVKFVPNPFDEYAVEEALKLKEQTNGEVVAVCLGPDASQETLRTALAMGADRGILLKAESAPLDPLVVARALAAELEQGGYDLVLFGKLAVDDYDQAVGTMVAELLGLPSVSAVTRLEITDRHATAQREVEGGVEVVEFTLPAIVTAEKGLNEPRYPALRGIMLAKKKRLDIKDVDLDESGVEVLELTLPPDRKAGRILGEGPAAVPALIEALRNEAKVL